MVVTSHTVVERCGQKLRSEGQGTHTQKGHKEIYRGQGMEPEGKMDGVTWPLQALQLPCTVEAEQVRKSGYRKQKAWRGSSEEGAC